MATRTETRFGAATSLGTTYTNLATVAASTTANVLFNVTNRTTSTVNFRAFIATNSWSSGEPTGGTIVAAVHYDMPVAAGETIQTSGIIYLTGEKIVVYSGAASALDVIACGVAIT